METGEKALLQKLLQRVSVVGDLAIRLTRAEKEQRVKWKIFILVAKFSHDGLKTSQYVFSMA